MPFQPASSALKRFKVLDLSRVRAGPTCVRMLSDFGADVVKIESPPTEDEGMSGSRDGYDMQNLHRNKRTVTLNLKKPEGQALFMKLVKEADVVVENFRPDVKYRLGVDYESLKRVNPRIILASISGFGEDGPYRERPGFDQIAQGMGGLMSITGLPGQGPVRAGIAIADTSSGLYAALGIMIALLEREESGEGQWVQSSLLGAQIAINDFQAARYLMTGEIPPQAGNDHPVTTPMGVFPSSDGFFNIGVSGQAIWKRLCAVINRPDLQDHPDYANEKARFKNRPALRAELEKTFKVQNTDYWINSLNEAGVPCGPINNMAQVFADPQVQHLHAAEEVEHPTLGRIKLVAQPVKLMRTPAAIKHTLRPAGTHNEEVYGSVGVSAAELAELKKNQVI
ncbi:MAG TPA: CaiB/BaiF CoA-transferase family protein [Burkholderiales bacterium]|nr:CaiB/BaiF CoA-transferase family protein [Burkholderiales bacterium]